jgi:5-methylcytosine-specific restriction endonuclease McrA
LTKKIRAEVLERAGGICEICKAVIEGRFDVDHRIALHHGGGDDDRNWRPLHPECHKEKTRLDSKVSAKIRRIEKKRAGPKKPSRLKSRGFPKSLKKKMNGRVSKRDAAN